MKNIVNKDNVNDANVNIRNNKIRCASDRSNPGTTCVFRAICKNEDGVQGKPRPKLIIDTNSISCRPSHKSCVIV